MARISDILRKISNKKPDSEGMFLSESLKIGKSIMTILEAKTLYHQTLREVSRILDSIKEGRTIESDLINSVAEKIVGDLTINKDVLLLLINNLDLYEKGDDYIYAHSLNSAILATNIGLGLGLARAEQIDLFASSLLHDIGILRVPQDLLSKPAKLTKEEYDLIKKHPQFGLELLKFIKDPPKSAAEVIYEHHERIDGTGYPEGKKGNRISMFAKIVAMVEVYEAITHPRPYHRIVPYEGVRMVVQESKGFFDPDLVKIFLNQITPYPPGSLVLLNNNQIGMVVNVNEDHPLRPVIQIIFEADGTPAEGFKKVNLVDSPVLHIKKVLSESNPQVSP